MEEAALEEHQAAIIHMEQRLLQRQGQATTLTRMIQVAILREDHTFLLIKKSPSNMVHTIKHWIRRKMEQRLSIRKQKIR